MAKVIGILTAGGDSPGLNAAIRGVGKSAIYAHQMEVIGFRDGFRGLMENRTVRLDSGMLSGILTVGGTILGTSRDKPHKMPIGGQKMDMTELIMENYRKHHLDVLVCLGGGGTQKNAYHLSQAGLDVITLPKTIDNDVACTDVTFGFDTALTIATDAIDRLHSTAHSHHRIVVVEIMGHNAGWLALGAGMAGGADVILIPEIPYETDKVAESILHRSRSGKRFSIVAVSEGAMSTEIAARLRDVEKRLAELDDQNGQDDDKDDKDDKDAKKAAKKERKKLKEARDQLEAERARSTHQLTADLEERTGLESRVTILGHLQRGGVPSAADRLLATRLGTACVNLIQDEVFGVMVASRGEGVEAVPLSEVAGRRKNVPLDHPWIESARNLGISLGD